MYRLEHASRVARVLEWAAALWKCLCVNYLHAAMNTYILHVCVCVCVCVCVWHTDIYILYLHAVYEYIHFAYGYMLIVLACCA